MTKTGSTALHDFGRTLRDEPAFGVYKHRIYLLKDKVSVEEVSAWLRQRYATARRGYLYRYVTYAHADGNRYIDFIWLQTCSDKDLIEIKMRWGYSEYRQARGERVPRRKLTKEQRAIRDAIVKRALEDFYNSL